MLKPLKAATKHLEGRSKGDDSAAAKCSATRSPASRFGALAEIIPVFEYVLSYYEQRVKSYEDVDYNAHDEAPKDHLIINLRAA